MKDNHWCCKEEGGEEARHLLPTEILKEIKIGKRKCIMNELQDQKGFFKSNYLSIPNTSD
jgi:hypothetical protein